MPNPVFTGLGDSAIAAPYRLDFANPALRRMHSENVVVLLGDWFAARFARVATIGGSNRDDAFHYTENVARDRVAALHISGNATADVAFGTNDLFAFRQHRHKVIVAR